MVLKSIQPKTSENATEKLSRLSESDNIVKDLDEEVQKKSVSPIVYIVLMVLMVLGVLTGFFLSRISPQQMAKGGVANLESAPVDGKKVVGVSDKQTFKDSAEGVIEAGGLDSEGTHKLIRDGGPSQTVYLISSVVDLDQFIGKQVTVWGQTMGAKKAAWLMDVGKVEIQ